MTVHAVHMRTMCVLVIAMSGCLATPTADAVETPDAGRDGVHVPVGETCDAAGLCDDRAGVCVPTAAVLVCRVQCRAAEYPRCADGLIEQHADIFNEGRELCFCVPGGAA